MQRRGEYNYKSAIITQARARIVAKGLQEAYGIFFGFGAH